MTLNEAIIHAEEVYKNKKGDAEEARLQEQDKYADECIECAAKHRQIAEWLRELKRADTLLKATYDLLNKQHGNYYVLNLLAETVYYDEAECDGNCLMEDIDAWMDERGIDHDTTRIDRIENAIRHIQTATDVDPWATEIAVEAMRKQIPKVLIAEGDGYADGEMVYDSFYCPSCDYYMEDYEVKNYCPNCGQAIDWEGEG